MQEGGSETEAEVDHVTEAAKREPKIVVNVSHGDTVGLDLFINNKLSGLFLLGRRFFVGEQLTFQVCLRLRVIIVSLLFISILLLLLSLEILLVIFLSILGDSVIV